MIPPERIRLMVDKARRDILPSLTDVGQICFSSDLEMIEQSDFFTLEEYLEKMQNLYPYSTCNPDIFCGIPYRESFDFFSKRGMILRPNPHGGHYLPIGTIEDYSLNERNPPKPLVWESFFGLEAGAFPTNIRSGGRFRMDKQGQLSEYLDEVSKSQKPFFLNELDVGQSGDAEKYAYIISGIDI